jgi:hypothetical protein
MNTPIIGIMMTGGVAELITARNYLMEEFKAEPSDFTHMTVINLQDDIIEFTYYPNLMSQEDIKGIMDTLSQTCEIDTIYND